MPDARGEAFDAVATAQERRLPGPAVLQKIAGVQTGKFAIELQTDRLA